MNFPDVFVADAFGLWGTTMPKTANPKQNDGDGDGMSDFDEFIANTHAGDAGDFLRVRSSVSEKGRGKLQVTARPGRVYQLWRSSELLESKAQWTLVNERGPFSNESLMDVEDAASTNEVHGFYHLKVMLPE